MLFHSQIHVGSPPRGLGALQTHFTLLSSRPSLVLNPRLGRTRTRQCVLGSCMTRGVPYSQKTLPSKGSHYLEHTWTLVVVSRLLPPASSRTPNTGRTSPADSCPKTLPSLSRAFSRPNYRVASGQSRPCIAGHSSFST